MFSEIQRRKLVRVMGRLMLMALCLFTVAKVMFIGLSADEEYQLLLTYRLARGDMLFREVWDTLQTSAFYGQFFMWIYLTLAHTSTGSLLFLRFCGIATQGCVSLFLFHTLKRHLKKENALFLSVAFFCTYTKLVAVPEFANMQTWSLVMVICFIWHAQGAFENDERKKGFLYLSAAALFFCAAILSAACVILIPVTAVLLYRMRREGGLKRNLLFWGICLACGTVYVLALCVINGLDTLLTGINGVLSGDGTHLGGLLLNGQLKREEYLEEAGSILVCMIVTLLVALSVSFIVSLVRRKQNNIWMMVWIAESFAVTLYEWFVKKSGYEGLKLYLPVLTVTGIYVFLRYLRSGKDPRAQIPSMLPAFYGIMIGMGVFANVLLISNVGIICNLTFLNTSALWGMVILVSHLEGKTVEGKSCPAAVLFCLLMIAGTGFTLNNGPVGRTVFEIKRGGTMQEGPTKGTVVSIPMAHIYDDSEKLFRGLIKEGSSVLLVTNFFHNQSLSTIYMVNNVNISHYTVNSTPTYGDKLYEYWEIYPGKRPDCIIINGDSCSSEDYLWALELLSEYDDMVEVSSYNVRYFVRPECLKEEFKNSY